MADVRYRAFANLKDIGGKKWRVNISLYCTREEAEAAVKRFTSKYSNDENLTVEHAGVHKYYIFPRKEWDRMQYTSVSAADGKTRTWMTHDEKRGTVLLFEGVHFEIAG